MKLISAEIVEKHARTPGTRNEIDEIIAPVLLAQKVYGQQILDSNWSYRKNALIHTCIILLLTYIFLGTVEFIKNNDEILLFCEAIFTLIVTVQYLIKFMCFAHYRTTFREAYVFAKTSLFGIIYEVLPEKSQHVTNMIRKITMAQLIMTTVSTLNYLCITLWFYFNGTRVTLSRSTSILMPMTSPCYEIGLVLHLIYLLMVTFGLTMVDFWFVILTYFFCETSDCAVKVLEVLKLKGETNVSYATRLNEALRKFYSIHVLLVEYLKMLNYMYKWPILVPLGAALASTCVFLLVLTEEMNFQLITVVMIASIQTFAYNALGERVKSKANAMHMAILNFDWTSLNLKDRKSYYIIVTYMNKSFGIRAAAGIELSLLTLSSIYKGSYQTFAVLNTMKN